MIKRTRQEQEKLVNECRASGKPAKAWCDSRGISYSTYMGWLKLLKQENPAQQKLASHELGQADPTIVWAALDVVAQESERPNHQQEGCCISLSRGGWSIGVGRGFDAELLAGVMKVVNRVCC